MRIRNNRYRKSLGRYYEHFKKEWRVYALIAGVSFAIAMVLVSWIYQWLGNLNGSLERYHIINPFFILYFGIIKAGGFTFLLGLLITVAASYYKFYIDMVDYEYDPRGFPISPKGTYGTNRVMSAEERDAFLEKTTIDKTDKNVVYRDEDGSVYVIKNPKGLGPHKFVCGASGSWKTSSQFIPDIMQMIRRGESGICTDPKGELRSKTYKMAKKYNYIVREFNLINPLLSDGCDFMRLVESYGDARTFTEVIMMNTSGDAAHNEDFWAKGERAAICFGILYVHEADEYKGKRTFKNVFEFLKSDLDTLNAKADMLPEGSNAKNQWRIFQTTPDNSKGGVMTGVTTRLQILNDPAIAEITGRDEIDLTLPGSRPCLYYVIVSDQDSSNNVITSIFFSFLFIKLVKMADQRLDQSLPVAVNFLLDEMPNVCKIPEFPKKLSTIRSRNMKCTICAQDVGQMQSLFPGTLWANVISNCDTQIMLGCNDPEITGPFWSKAYGTMTIVVETEKDAGDRFAPININNERGISTGDGQREVFTVGEICNLENKYALVRFRGHNVIKGLKFSYFEHPMFEEIEEENYFQHKPMWWKDVANEAANCDNLKEYEWFENGIMELDALNQKLEEESKEQKRREADIAKKNKANRVANGAEPDQEEKKDWKVYLIRSKRRLSAFLSSLHGNIKEDSGAAGAQDEGLKRAFDLFAGQTGKEEASHDDAYLATEDEDEALHAKDESHDQPEDSEHSQDGEPNDPGSGEGNPVPEDVDMKDDTDEKHTESRQSEEEASQARLIKNIHRNFKPAEEPSEKTEEERPKKKRSFSDSAAEIVGRAAKESPKDAGDEKPEPRRPKTEKARPEPEKKPKPVKEELEEDPVTEADQDFESYHVNVPWAYENPLDDFEPDEDSYEPQIGEPDIPEPDFDVPRMDETEMAPVQPDPVLEETDQMVGIDTVDVVKTLKQSRQRQRERQEKIDRNTTNRTKGL